MADFAASYADQNEQDHQALADAVAIGRLEATRWVVSEVVIAFFMVDDPERPDLTR